MKMNFKKIMTLAMLVFSLAGISVFGQSITGEISKIPKFGEELRNKFKADNKQEKAGSLSVSSKSDTTFHPQLVRHYDWQTGTWNPMYNELWAYNPDLSVSSIVIIDHISGDSVNMRSFTYDAQKRVVMILEKMSFGNGWENSGRESFVYDAQGNRTEELYETWYSGSWMIIWGERKTYTYNANNDPTEIIYQDYDYQSSSWRNYEKEEFTYDVAGNMNQMIYFDWDSVSAWKQYERVSIAYGAQTTPTKIAIDDWDNTQNSWVPMARVDTITWHNWTGSITNAKPSFYIFQVYYATVWVDFQRVTATYDNYGGYVVVYEENASTGWQNESRESEGYDNKLNYLGYEYEIWNNSAWEVDNGLKYVFIYNASGATLERVTQDWDGINGVYENFWKEEYFNFITSDMPVSIPSLNARIYPNPAENVTYIDLPTDSRNAQIDIINIQGSLVYSSKSNGGTVNLDLSGLAKGVYFVRIHADGLLQIEKLVIK